jgi:hypothetical protein
VSDVTISVQQERLTKLEFIKLQVMVQKQAWSYLGKRDNCTLWNYCNNLYITYIVLKLGESTGMLISVRVLRATIASYYLPFWNLYTVYDIKLLLHHGFVVTQAVDCWKSDLHLSWHLKGLPSVSVSSKCLWRTQVTSELIQVVLFVWHSLTVEQKAIFIFIGFSNQKCCFVMSRNNNKFAYIYIVVWQIWTETFSSDALKDSKLQNWQRFIPYNLKKGNEMECKFIICQITYNSVCTGGVSFVCPNTDMSVYCSPNTKTWNFFSFLQLVSLFLSFSKLKFHFQYLKSTNWSIQEYETKSGFVALP